MNPFIIIITLFFGVLGGVLVNFIADVFPLAEEKQNIKEYFSPVCTGCQQKISWKNFLFVNRCEACKQKKSIRTWIILILIPILFTFVVMLPPKGINGIGMGLLIIYFGAVASIDIKERIILRSLTFFGWIFTCLIGFLFHPIALTMLGGVSGLIIMLGLYYAGVLFKKDMEKRKGIEVDDALGFGDVYISIMAGFILAFPNIIYGLLLSILLGGMLSLIYLVGMLVKKEYKPFTPIPYAPFILLATMLILYRPIY
jgi:prepilin signal peptidase PulO-like enzyme (type II secretory pathway)